MRRQSRNSTLTASDRIRDKLVETGESLADVGHLAKTAVRDKFVDLKSAAVEGLQTGKNRLIDMEHGFEERVRERPVKYLLIAAGVGALLGMWFRRS